MRFGSFDPDPLTVAPSDDPSHSLSCKRHHPNRYRQKFRRVSRLQTPKPKSLASRRFQSWRFSRIEVGSHFFERASALVSHGLSRL